MRTGGAFETQEAAPPHNNMQRQEMASAGWKSPVPYLFGGLAAMLGLIAFALLILACSYWKLSGYLDHSAGEEDAGAGEGNPGEDGDKDKVGSLYGNSILVIMAGQEKPTFLATPASSRVSSFGDDSKGSCSTCSCSSSSSGSGRSSDDDDVERREKVVEMGGGGAGGDEVERR